MNITDIKLRKVVNNEKLKGYVTVTFDEELVVHNIKIIQSGEGLFIAMPSKKGNNGEYKDVVHPITPDARVRLTKTIISYYEDHKNDL